MSDWLISVSKDAVSRHSEYRDMTETPGTPYVSGDSDHSTQLVGAAIVDGVERVYWVSPRSQVNRVVHDLSGRTRERVYVQRSIPEEFTQQMRDMVIAFFSDLRYRTEFEGSRAE